MAQPQRMVPDRRGQGHFSAQVLQGTSGTGWMERREVTVQAKRIKKRTVRRIATRSLGDALGPGTGTAITFIWNQFTAIVLGIKGCPGYHLSMRSMFGVGFDREVFSVRHPSMGLSFSELQTYWKEYYPKAKEGLKTLTTQQIPGTNPTQAPIKPAAAPSSGSSTLLWVGGLAVLGLGGYYFLADRPFGMKKK